MTADYFLAVTIRDTNALRRLFAYDAVLYAQGTVYEGIEAIAAASMMRERSSSRTCFPNPLSIG